MDQEIEQQKIDIQEQKAEIKEMKEQLQGLSGPEVEVRNMRIDRAQDLLLEYTKRLNRLEKRIWPAQGA